jgi:two-component system LytT family response regulator
MSEATIRTVIIDDEPLSRQLVRHMLRAHPDFTIIAECGDGEFALETIRRHEPRVAFVDIKMPRLDGMSLLQQVPADAQLLVVFITAHEEFAVQAFREHAFDYLLKPFDAERFDQTIGRVRRRLEQIAAAQLGHQVRELLAHRRLESAAARPALDRIVVRESGRIYFVPVAEIDWLEASGNYVALHVTSGKTHLVHETMTTLEERMDPAEFVRIHRSTMVRVERIKELLPHFNGEFIVVLKDNVRLKLSRTYLDKARAALGLVDR